MDQLSTACRNGDIESVKAALSSNTNARDLQKCLRIAIQANHVPIIALLLEQGVPIGEWSFFAAGDAESPDVYRCFLDHGWDINSVEHGLSALCMSTGEGQEPSMATWLLDHGADPNVKSQYHGLGRTRPVSIMRSAIASNNLPVMRILLAYGAMLEAELFEPCFAPWFEAEHPMLPTLQFLLDYGLNPNVVIERGNGTPLQLAVRRGMLDKTRALLLAGASQDIVNRVGETPLEEAERAENQAMIGLLQSNGRGLEQFDT